jgi:hypothetical protein
VKGYAAPGVATTSLMTNTARRGPRSRR